MAKITISDLSGGFASIDALNAAFQDLEDELNNKVLYRNNPLGEPNSMQSNLDMNGKSILNISTWEADNLSVQNLTLNGELVVPSDLATSTLPDHTGNDGKYLKTDGSTASWQDLSYTPGGTGAVVTTVQSKLREFVSVTDFGAVGDGVTNDTAAIQAAIDYAYSIGTGLSGGGVNMFKYGKAVFMPNGVYSVSSLHIPEGVDLIGENMHATKLAAQATGGHVLIVDPVAGTNYQAKQAPKSTLRNFSIDGGNYGVILGKLAMATSGSPVLTMSSAANADVLPGYRLRAQGFTTDATVLSVVGDVVTVNENSSMTYAAVSKTDCVVTTGSVTVTLPDAWSIGVGMSVSGTGIPAGTTIVGKDDLIITLSAPATSSGTVTLSFENMPVRFIKGVEYSGATTDGSNVITLAATTGITVGMSVSGSSVRGGSYVESVGATEVVMSLPAKETGTTTIFFSEEKIGLLVNSIYADTAYDPDNIVAYVGPNLYDIDITRMSGDGFHIIGTAGNQTHMENCHAVYCTGRGLMANSPNDILVIASAFGSCWRAATRVATAATPRFIGCEFWGTLLSDQESEFEVYKCKHGATVIGADINGTVEITGDGEIQNNQLTSINFLFNKNNPRNDGTQQPGYIRINSCYGTVVTNTAFKKNAISQAADYLVYFVQYADTNGAALIGCQFGADAYNTDTSNYPGLLHLSAVDNTNKRTLFSKIEVDGRGGAAVSINRNDTTGPAIWGTYDDTRVGSIEISPTGLAGRRDDYGAKGFGVGGTTVGDGWKEPLRLGSGYLWLDSTNTLRTTAGIPITRKDITLLTSLGTTATAECTGHGLTSGDYTQIYGAEESDYCVLVQVTVTDANHFTYTVTTMGKSVTTLVSTGTTATATCVGHDLETGRTVTIAGAAVSDYNGTYVITVVDDDTFTYTMATDPADTTAGTITATPASLVAACFKFPVQGDTDGSAV